MSDPLLVFDAVSKTHRRGTEAVHALVEVSLEIEAGDFVVVTGPSGAGKSTLLHVAAGLEPVDAGRILVGGEDLTTMSERAKAAWRCRGLGYVFQFFHLVGNLSAVENVAVPLLLAGAKRADAETRARQALDEVGLGQRLDHTPAQLSGGQMQRVAVARALVTGAPLLFADEPTGNLDSTSGAEVLELIRRANREQGCAVVLVTHDAGVEQDGDRFVNLQDGRYLTKTVVG